MQKPRTEISLRHMLSIAAPMVVSQASETLMLFFNRWVVSFLGADHIPASMSGGLSAFVFTAFFAGITGYVNALAAQYHGAGRESRCVQTATQGFWLALAFYPFLLLLIPAGHSLFVLAGHDPRQVVLEFSYYRILMIGSFLFLFQSVLVGYFIGIGRTRVVMTAYRTSSAESRFARAASVFRRNFPQRSSSQATPSPPWGSKLRWGDKGGRSPPVIAE